jgi:hypothetical protein
MESPQKEAEDKPEGDLEQGTKRLLRAPEKRIFRIPQKIKLHKFTLSGLFTPCFRTWTGLI